MGVFATTQDGRNKISLLVKENQISQIKEFGAFLCVGKFKILVSLKSFLSYAPQLSEASILCFQILRSLKLHHWGCLQSDDCQMAGISYFHGESLQVLPSGRLLMWWLDPLFTDMTGSLTFFFFFFLIFQVEEKACTSLQFMYATDMCKGQ